MSRGGHRLDVGDGQVSLFVDPWGRGRVGWVIYEARTIGWGRERRTVELPSFGVQELPNVLPRPGPASVGHADHDSNRIVVLLEGPEVFPEPADDRDVAGDVQAGHIDAVDGRAATASCTPFQACRKGHRLASQIPTLPRVNHGFGLTHADQASIEDGVELLTALEQMHVSWICITGGSPYYNPHTQRPALFPPLDGYLPPEDPLPGVARQIDVTARLKQRFPNLVLVGSAYSYLQEWLPNVAQHAVRKGLTDFVGLGRIVLSYPGSAGGRAQRHASCAASPSAARSATAPPVRGSGMVSGCYPLDLFYMAKPEAAIILKKRPKLLTE